MKILPVSNYYQKNYSASVNEKKHTRSNNHPTFNGWTVDVLDLSDDELKNAAKHFYKSTDEELIEVTTETFMGIRRKNKSLAAYYKLKYAIDQTKRELELIQSKIQNLESKPDKDETDINTLEKLKSQLEEYETAFEHRKIRYFYNPIVDGPDINDLVDQAKASGSWYYP